MRSTASLFPCSARFGELRRCTRSGPEARRTPFTYSLHHLESPDFGKDIRGGYVARRLAHDDSGPSRSLWTRALRLAGRKHPDGRDSERGRNVQRAGIMADEEP